MITLKCKAENSLFKNVTLCNIIKNFQILKLIILRTKKLLLQTELRRKLFLIEDYRGFRIKI